MKKALSILTFVISLLSAPYLIAITTTDHVHDGATNVGHSGGTDAYGCHHDKKRGGYHCH